VRRKIPITLSRVDAAILLGADTLAAFMEALVDVGDLPVLLSAEDGRRAAALRQLLGQTPSSQASPKLLISYRVDGPELPARAPDARSSQIQLWFEGAGLRALEASGVSASVCGDEVWLGGPSFDPAGGLDRLALPLLTHALFPHERFVLHAGAIDHEGRAVLLLGASGMGKSTLAFAGVGAGWTVLADDTVMLRIGEHETFEVAGLSGRPIVVPGELLDALDRPGEPLVGDARRRRALRELTPRSGWSTVAGSVVAAHGEAPATVLSRVDSGAALAALLLSFTGAINPSLLPEFFVAAHALAQRPSFQLAQGRDPGSRLAGTQACLRQLVSSICWGHR
jgi:hypothetical protein